MFLQNIYGCFLNYFQIKWYSTYLYRMHAALLVIRPFKWKFICNHPLLMWRAWKLADFVNGSSFQNQCQVDAKKPIICILLFYIRRSPDARHGSKGLIFPLLVFSLALTVSFLAPFPSLHFGMRMFILGHCIL